MELERNPTLLGDLKKNGTAARFATIPITETQTRDKKKRIEKIKFLTCSFQKPFSTSKSSTFVLFVLVILLPYRFHQPSKLATNPLKLIHILKPTSNSCSPTFPIITFSQPIPRRYCEAAWHHHQQQFHQSSSSWPIPQKPGS